MHFRTKSNRPVNQIQIEVIELQVPESFFKCRPHVVAKMPDHELWMTFFTDLDGNTLALMSEVR